MSPSPATRVPPQNIEAEESVLGAMLVTEPALTRVIDEVGLEADDFYLPKHAAIFEAIRGLYADRKPVDELSVSQKLKEEGTLEDAGGKHYVSELAAKVPAAGNAKHHAEIVQCEAGLNGLLQAGQSIVEGVNEGGDAVELVKAAGEAVEAAEIKAAPKIVRTADISRVRPIRWAWRGRLLLGYLNLLLGAEGVGKGTLIAWLIAQITHGELPGDLEGKPSRVLVLGDEDGFDSVWVPRLYAAGADLDLVDTLEGEFDLGLGAGPLRSLVARHDYRLVFFDQLLDNLGVDVDDWRAKDIRERLRPLRRVARELDVLMLGALHPNKGQRSSFRDLVSGSHAFNALSRSSLLLAQHPEDEQRRVLVRGKGNLSAPPPSFEFTIEGRDLEINGHAFSLPVVAQEADGELSVDDILRPSREAPVRDGLADVIDGIGTGRPQRRSEIAKALGRSSDDRSVGRALEQLEDEGRWNKVGRGLWQKVGIGIGASKEAPMPKGPEIGGDER
jgi:hypothetical protein